jgi:hypothetical protein
MGDIGVFVIDADLHVMPAVANLAVELWDRHVLPRLPLDAIVLRESSDHASGLWSDANIRIPSQQALLRMLASKDH